MNVKGLLLGTFGMVAATGAAAADLPVAPEPIDYVRVCDAFGTGFFYIPGTETCLRVSGRVRVDYRYYNNDGLEHAGPSGSNRGRNVNRTRFFTRAYLNLDSRTNTEFGLLRTYAQVYWSHITGTATASTTLYYGFIQWGGLTAGRAESFYNFYAGDTFAAIFTPSYSDIRTNLLAYTAAFGNGFSATLSLEDGSFRRTSIIPANPGFTDAYGGHWYPDLVANARVDQAWGSAQIMGALHDVRDGVGPVDDSEIGWAIGGGARFNLPMIASGDQINIQATYSKGAITYAGEPDDMFAGVLGLSVFGVDGIRRPGGRILLTTAWSVAGGFTHFWTPSVSSAFTGSYMDVDQGVGRITDFEQWDIQGNVVWHPASGFIVGAEVEYRYVDYSIPIRGSGDHDDIVGLMRFQRSF